MRAITISLLSSMLLATVAGAEPSSNVAWDTQTLVLVASGDPAHGESLAAACAGCHGQDGVALQPLWPDLAGQRAQYTYKQLKDFKDRKRENPVMYPFVDSLSDRDMADLAAWYASLAPPAEGAGGAAVPALAARGDPVRLIPPCASCHQREVRGERDYPRLDGQHAEYLQASLRAYGSGTRANDVYSRMRSIAAQLSDAEIAALAQYYAAR